jgi:predicted nucleic acid-binding protein
LLNVPLLLTDDLSARDAARAMGVRPVGSLGIIVRAYHGGLISLSEAEASLDRLDRDSSLFVTRAIVDLALGELRRPPG